MTEQLELTAERRGELAALLEDEHRLRAEFPTVAQYLEVASRFPQQADSRDETAFDLRLLHYMTGGRATSANPYWDIVAPAVSEHEGRRVVDGGRPGGSGQLGFAQITLQAAYAYAIPCPETVEWVRAFCEGHPILEVGAGRGYWAAQLAGAGLAIDAFELEPPDTIGNANFPRAKGQADVWFGVRDLEALRGVEDRSDHVLFLCWPPGWGNTMASETLAAFERAGGRRLVYIGEPRGGKTGDEAFFDALEARWRLDSEDKRFVSWWNLDDAAQGWLLR